jgi:corrinoid protein of di/trimethylamine methyltransferase
MHPTFSANILISFNPNQYDQEWFMSEQIYSAMSQSIIDGESEEAAKLAAQSIELGIDPLDAINHGFVVGVNHVGNLFSSGEAFLPELVMAGEAMKAAVNALEPEMSKQGKGREILGTIVLGTIEGDIHDIGKSLVGTMLSVVGFKVFDLGVDVPVPTLVEKARTEDADIIGVSALLTTTMMKQRDVVEALDDIGLRSTIKVMVGGAPVTSDWAEEIGADGYSEDAVGAVAVARELLAAKALQKE